MRTKQVRRAYILIIIIISIAAVIIGFKYILPLFFPFVVGYFLAWIAAPIVLALEKKCRIPRVIASIFVVGTFLIIGVIGIYFLGRALFCQIQCLIEELPMYQQTLFVRLRGICKSCDRFLSLDAGTSYSFLSERIQDGMDFMQNHFFSGQTSPAIGIAFEIVDVLWNVIVILISTLLLVKEFPEYKKEFRESCFYKEIHMVTSVLSNMGIAYLKAQFILMCITSVICMIGVLLTGNRYAILIGIGIGVFDAFPILGSACILIPWAILLFFKKRILHGVIILVTYLVCELIRQILEPKLVGDRIGVRPVYTLISMYVGLKIYGAFGFILGPISLIAIRAIVDAGLTKLSGED